MVWLARKAFFGHVPFPVMHIDTGQEVSRDVRLPRSLYAGVEPQPDPGAMPAGRGDRSHPAAGGPLRCAQDAGPEGRDREARLPRHHRRHPPRRGERAGQGAGLQPARRQRPMGFPRPAAGILGPFQHRLCRRERICASIRCCIGPSATSGATSSARTFRWSISISPGTASATARWAIPTSPLRWRAMPPRSTRSSPSSRRRRAPERAGRAMDRETEDAFERLRAAGYM